MQNSVFNLQSNCYLNEGEDMKKLNNEKEVENFITSNTISN